MRAGRRRTAAPYPTPRQRRALASVGAPAAWPATWGLALAKERRQARARGEGGEVPWTLPALRRAWNRSGSGARSGTPFPDGGAGCAWGEGARRRRNPVRAAGPVRPPVLGPRRTRSGRREAQQRELQRARRCCRSRGRRP
ncbi:hypothetical protein E1B22_02870 [Thermaerobacter sp. FW80]|nr:hypothetical protein E1B22_02870 [Thermaerobacter sp. FW80]